MSRKAPAPRHAGISRPVRQERDRKEGHLDQGQRGDRGLTASSIEPVACPAYPSSISPLISWEKLVPPSVTVARAGKVSLPLSRPSARAWRTAFSISRFAHLSAAVGAGALQGLWEHKGSRCTPANAAHSPPRRSPAPARARHAAPDGQAHSQPTDQPPSPPTHAGAASSQQSPPACPA